MRRHPSLGPTLALAAILACAAPSRANLSRNATTAKNLGEAARLTVDTAAEVAREPDERTWTLSCDVQYQLSARFSLLVEAAALESHDPDAGASVRGVGDTDVTVAWLAREEGGAFPPIVLAAKAKIPTAGKGEIGTGKADYSALIILGKEYGELEVNLELELATFGSPGGAALKDQFLYTLAFDYGITDKLSAYAELSGNSAPTDDESRTDAAKVGLEVEFPLSEVAAPYIAVEADTEEARSARAGVEWSW